jgi:hypothetical protein
MNRTARPIQTATFGVPEYEMKWEGTYRPRISSEHLRRLWSLKQRAKKPITKLVAEALDYYFENAVDEDGKPIYK